MPFQDIKAAVFNQRMLICIFTGFASGLPLYILIQLVPGWLRDEGVGLAEIGFFTLIGLPYTWKFLWSPLLERYQPKWLGRRRGWMMASQLGLLLTIAVLGTFDPNTQLWSIAVLCTLVALLSATQDIALDAYRRELLPDPELGLGNSIHVNAYRVAGLVPGGLSLILADLPLWDWDMVFWVTAVFMLPGILMTALVKEPKHLSPPPTSLRDAVIEPFKEFFFRDGSKRAWLILWFIVLYKLADNMAVALQTPFFLDIGFSKTDIGLIAKSVGFWASTIGTIFGGLAMIRLGINRALWIFGFVQLVSILGFAALAHIGENKVMLAVAMGFEYLGVGLGAAALVAFMARTTSKLHTATQLALFTALAALPRTAANAVTGIIVEAVGWELFFYLCTVLAIPGMLLLFKVAPWNGDRQAASPQAAQQNP
ncbi:AmpG family muropeptide MFS transporter [bacterium SCSIO 12696]|nr:AmpG family muropeptide MFS transporter [bacterium SCSIO 12696]